MIPVTKPFLPPIDEYKSYIDGIYKREWLTNNGPLVNELELNLKDFLGLEHLLFLSNETIAIQIAIKALELTGEIITTPFSYVATTNSILWEGCKAVFVDIDKESLNIDPLKIEAAINERTSAILATHVYGNPCDIDAIQKVADKYGLKVIYDAAHCFGTKFKGKSVFEFGDISTTSFHSTKLFHTIEGGAVFTKDSILLKKMASLRNFGHDGPDKFVLAGVNGKNSEFHAAMGLSNLKYISEIMNRRKWQCEFYLEKLKNLNAQFIKVNNDSEFNFAYFPIVLPSESITNEIISELNKNWVYPRRYFSPSLNVLPYLDSMSCPVSEDISNRVICLPLYFDLTKEEIDLIARIILRVQNN